MSNHNTMQETFDAVYRERIRQRKERADAKGGISCITNTTPMQNCLPLLPAQLPCVITVAKRAHAQKSFLIVPAAPCKMVVSAGGFSITPEQLLAFRNQLRKEIFGPQLWYHPSKEENKDVVGVHPECPYASNCGKIAEHRYVWWLHHQNEPIQYNEMIHHINGNHQDNRIENLEKVKPKQHGVRHKELRDSKINV